MLYIIIPAFFIAGAALFSITAAAFIYSTVFFVKKHRKKTSIEEIAQKLDTLKKSPGKRTTPLSMHLHDKTIMIPMLQAKLNWHKAVSAGTVKQITITNTVGQKLTGYIRYPSVQPVKYAVVLIHGYTDSASGTAFLSDAYIERGIATLSIDCRAHGNSQGEITGMGYTDASDLHLWIYECQEQFGQTCSIIIHGISMGAATVLLYISRCAEYQSLPKPQIAVSDCSFSDLFQLLLYQSKNVIGKHMLQKAISLCIVSSMSLINAVCGGFFFRKSAPASALRRTGQADIPLILFHGTQDTMIPFSMAQELYQSADKDHTLFISVPDAPHIGSYFYKPDLYMNTIMDKLKEI